MPFNVIEILLKAFNEAKEKLDFARIVKPDLVSDNVYNAFDAVINSIKTANSYIQEELKDVPLTQAKANLLSSFMSDVEIKINNFVESYPALDYSNPELGFYVFADSGEYMIPLTAQMELLSAFNPVSGTETINDILSDYTWVGTIFNEDPQVTENKKKEIVNWSHSEYSISDNMKKYKEVIKDLPGNFLNHMKVITGDDQNPMESFSRKVDLVQRALNCAAGNRNDVPVVTGVKQSYNYAYESFNTDEINELKPGTLIESRLFETTLTRRFDIINSVFLPL